MRFSLLVPKKSFLVQIIKIWDKLHHILNLINFHMKEKMWRRLNFLYTEKHVRKLFLSLINNTLTEKNSHKT